jgi:Bacterial SH3 domain
MRTIECLVGVAVLVSMAACAPTLPDPASPGPARVDTVAMVDTVRVETPSPANADLEDRVARLQIQVLEKNVQLAELQDQLEATRLELVRNMARLSTQATRAEAASGMAEAEIALRALRTAEGGEALPELAQANDLFQQSSTEFNGENYGGALYLATQARTLVRSGQARLRSVSGGGLREGESMFARPVPLKTTGRSNVRSGPGLDFDVKFTLESAASVVGQSYTSQWVRVVDDSGREGWIFQSLVSPR